MANILEPPATASLQATFDMEQDSVLSSPQEIRYIRDRPRHYDRFSRANSEPIDVSYHPELYDKLNSLWQQANSLISAQPCPTSAYTMPVASKKMDQASPATEQPPPTASIINSEVFRIIYNNQVHLDHFALTKQEIPFIESVHNREFMNWVAAKEPGVKVNYDEIRSNLARLSKEPILRHNSPNVFNFFHNFLRAHDMFVLRGARFLSFDLWMNIIQSYYGSPGDVGLLSKFPVTEPAAFKDYITTSAKAMSEESLANRRRNWTETHEQWREAETTIFNIKSSKEFYRRYEQLQKLMKIFRNQFDERSKRNRALRVIQANRRADRKRVLKAANIEAWREQIDSEGSPEIDHQQSQVSHYQVEEVYGQHTRLPDVDETITLPTKLQGMMIHDFPHD